VRAREADSEGFVDSDGVELHYEVTGDVGPTILLMPTWTIIHKRFWKAQVPYLARHFRVVSYDGPGNGRSSRPLDSTAYDHDAQVRHALAVLDVTATDKAVVVALSVASYWALALAADHPERTLGVVTIGPSLALAAPHDFREAKGWWGLPPSHVPLLGTDPPAHWAKDDTDYWAEHHEDFLWFFFGQCFTEPRSSKQVEDCVGWGLETSAEVLVADHASVYPDRDALRATCARISVPVLSIHGTEDQVSPPTRSEELVRLTGGELVLMEGAGHIPLARDPVRVNHLIAEFAGRFQERAPRPWRRGRVRPRKILYLSSPIGLGHARRDVAIAQALRARHPDVQIDWLAQHPVTKVLQGAGEKVHPASRWLSSESKHIEQESGEHDLHCFEALRRMDEVLVNNFMVFDDVVREDDYDLVIGDEAWDVDHFLHENPELKRFAYVWMTDFVGYLPMPDDDERGRLVAADYNAEMIEHIERYPRLRDRAIFVGNPRDIVPDRFGPDLPVIGEWTRRHYDFSGYVTGIDPGALADKARLRNELGWGEEERVCVVTVGGSGVGTHLLQRVFEAHDAACEAIPGLQMVVVTGPRIDPKLVAARPGLEVHAYLPDLYRQLGAADLAVVQGGLTTTMELTAAGTPFIYVPLRHHFEQNFHVRHRLDQYGAGRCLDYDQLTPTSLAAAMAEQLDTTTDFLPVESDGADRAASMISDLL